jgi:DNA invertase Pin-like site-specific DNA recombinase
MLNVFLAFAQFESEIMKERQREGIANAKIAGKLASQRPGLRQRRLSSIL